MPMVELMMYAPSLRDHPADIAAGLDQALGAVAGPDW